jgi:hypothetical protein
MKFENYTPLKTLISNLYYISVFEIYIKIVECLYLIGCQYFSHVMLLLNG